MRTIVAIFIVSILGASFAGAAQQAPEARKDSAASSGLLTWFKNWKQGLEKSAVESRYRRVRTTSVAAVRGDGQAGEDVRKPYWKGKLSEKKAAERMTERKELEEAVTLAIEGKYQEAEKRFDAFEAAHPKSDFLADIKEARAKLAELKGQSSEASVAKTQSDSAPVE